MIAANRPKRPSVTKAEMREVYEKIKTPVKLGPVMKWEKEFTDSATVFKKDGVFYMCFISISKDVSVSGYETHMARSADLKDWEYMGKVLRRNDYNHWDSKQCAGYTAFPDIRYEGEGQLEMVNGMYYLSYGDKTLLAQQYENMKSWVDYIRKVDVERCGGRYLWTDGFHFADWLALDNFHKDSCFGATDPYLVASAYYYYSVKLTEKAAAELDKNKDAAYYGELAAHIKEAFLDEYYSRTGRLVQETQTALAIVLWLDLIPEGARQRQVDTLMAKLKEENMHLTTGFVGTPLLCPVLTENGHADAAYTLLLNEDFPSWLYEVNMGATTVWERWNSVLPDGSISDTGMNSLNHYAYGSIVEWMYRYMCGLNSSSPAYKRFKICPYTDERFDWVRMLYDSAYGVIRSEWKKKDDGVLYTVEIPFDTEAYFVLNHDARITKINGESCVPLKKGEAIHLKKGVYQIYAE